MIDVNDFLNQTISETKNLAVGETFLVKDLFKGYMWNRIPRNSRLLLRHHRTKLLQQTAKCDIL